MTLITRAEWGARQPTSVTALSTPVREIWIHHGAGSSTGPVEQWRGYQRYHMDTLGWSDIAYSFGIGRGGEVLEGRGALRVGGGTGSPQDSYSYSVCFIGNFETEQPTQAALDACADLLADLIESQLLTRDFTIHGDREKNQTACPGKHLYARIQEIRTAALAIVDDTQGEDMLTVDLIRTGHTAKGADEFARAALAELGFRPGAQGLQMEQAVIRAKRQWFPSGSDFDGVIRGPFWRRMIAELSGACPEAVIAQLPPADCTACEGELAKARGELASALTQIRAAKDALV